MRVRLNGTSFVTLPHIRNRWRNAAGELVRGEECVVVREVGKPYDSDAKPAYSVRLEGKHIGYIPLVETIKAEWLNAKKGLGKVNGGWKEIDPQQAKDIARSKEQECTAVEIVRDFLYVEMERNHLTPVGRAVAVYFDPIEGRNTQEIGEVCSVSVDFEIH